MKSYILNCIVSPELSENEVSEIKKSISSLIQNEGGNIIRVAEGGIINLGYEIKKKDKGYLELINFNILPEKLNTLNAKLKEIENLLRFMIESKKIVKEKSVASLSFSAPKDSDEKRQKTSLKEIDKKIEEILKS